jgi:RNA polymerase sigma-70 factor (ECF subfamily)
MRQRITRAKAKIRVAATAPTTWTRAELLRRLGQSEGPRMASDRAIELLGNTAETAHLTRRRNQLG